MSDGGTPEAASPEEAGASSGEAGASSGEAGSPPAVAGAQITLSPLSGDFAGAIGAKVPPSTFTVTDTGSEATGPISVDLSGTGFTLSSDQCTGKSLDSGGSCTIGVGFFSAAALASSTGELRVSASPGGESRASLTGSAVVAAKLTLAPEVSSTTVFGDVTVGAHMEETFVVSNTGAQTSSPLQIHLTDPSFSLVAPSGPGSCVPGTTALKGGATCKFTVSFAPTGHGPVTSSLTVSASTGGSPTPLTLTGNGVVPATLTVDVPTKNFGSLEVGVSSAPLTLTFTNTGDVATGAITATASSELVVGAGCASLAPLASCMVQVSFKPANIGPRTAMLTLAGAAGGTVSFYAKALGMHRLTVSRPGTSAGRVTSSPAGIDCSAAGGATCSALFADGQVVLSARTTNGSNAFFSGWSGGGCTGPGVDCQVNFIATTTVVATFSPMANNLIFETHEQFPTTLGSATAYDAKCNLVATAAGLNNLAGTGYIAYVSSPASLATTRLGSARGWVRLDGRPFADTQASIFNTQQIFNPIAFDETGAPAGQGPPLTGTQSGGQLGESCSGWTSTAGTFIQGNVYGGPYVWGGVGPGVAGCALAGPLFCMGITKTAAVAPQVTAGRKIWLSSTDFIPGSGSTPDQKCQADRAAGVTTAIAFIAYTTKSAGSLLAPTQKYVRPDGTLVGTGAELGASANLESGIWQSAGGTYEFNGPMTGSTAVSALGTATCGDWTSTVGTNSSGAANYTNDSIWWTGYAYPCSSGGRLYCVQTVP